MDPLLTSLGPDPFHHATRVPKPGVAGPVGVGAGVDVGVGVDVEGARQCAWCARAFPVVLRPGRPRIYCCASCRQRAYERRSGYGVLPPVDRRASRPAASSTPATGPRRAPAYQAGWSPAGDRLHALRTVARPDERGRWPTLCGVLARPIDRPFHGARADACETCVATMDVRPPSRPFAPAQQLAELRSVLEDAGTWLDRRNRWMRGHWVTDDHPPAPSTFGELLSVRQLLLRLVEAA